MSGMVVNRRAVLALLALLLVAAASWYVAVGVLGDRLEEARAEEAALEAEVVERAAQVQSLRGGGEPAGELGAAIRAGETLDAWVPPQLQRAEAAQRLSSLAAAQGVALEDLSTSGAVEEGPLVGEEYSVAVEGALGNVAGWLVALSDSLDPLTTIRGVSVSFDEDGAAQVSHTVAVWSHPDGGMHRAAERADIDDLDDVDLDDLPDDVREELEADDEGGD